MANRFIDMNLLLKDKTGRNRQTSIQNRSTTYSQSQSYSWQNEVPIPPLEANQNEFSMSLYYWVNFLFYSKGTINADIATAIFNGEHNEDELSNQVFYWRHPELMIDGVRKKLSKDKDKDRDLKKEWRDIKNGIVQPLFIWPQKPDHLDMYDPKERNRVFGEFAYVAAPDDDPRTIRITDGWDRQNIIPVNIPQIIGKRHHNGTAITSGEIDFNKLGASQLADLWKAWDTAGLLNRVINYSGSFVPRFITGSTRLSNHSWGTAFDINENWNQRGHQPALLGEVGCTRELVRIANQHGFFWGGHFGGSSTDGMHFELGKVI